MLMSLNGSPKLSFCLDPVLPHKLVLTIDDSVRSHGAAKLEGNC